MTLLSKERIEALIKENLGMKITLTPVPDMTFGNRADYHAAIALDYHTEQGWLPVSFTGVKKPRIYARTYDNMVVVYLTFDNEIRADNYDSGFYTCDGRHFIVLFEWKKGKEK